MQRHGLGGILAVAAFFAVSQAVLFGQQPQWAGQPIYGQQPQSQSTYGPGQWTNYPPSAQPQFYGAANSYAQQFDERTRNVAYDTAEGNASGHVYLDSNEYEDSNGYGIKLFGGPHEADQSRNQMFAGGAALFLKADMNSDLAFTVVDLATATQVNRNFGYDKEGAWKVWVGWQGDKGLAAKVTYFQIDDRSSQFASTAVATDRFNPPSSPIAGAPLAFGGAGGDFANALSSFKIWSITGDLSQELNFDRWQTTYGGGVRFASVEHSYAVNGTASGVAGRLSIKNRFDGVGPTLFTEIRIPFIGVRDRRYLRSANLSLIAKARGSALIGNNKLAATDVSVGVTRTASVRDSKTVVIAESQLGAQFDVRTAGGTLLWVKGVWEVQWWGNGGNSSNPDQDLTLIGYGLYGGMDW